MYIYLAVAAVAFLEGCAKEYFRVTKRPSSPPPPLPAADQEPVSDPGDPCPGQSCAGAEETRDKGAGPNNAWIVGEPTETDTYVQIGDTQVDASQNIYSVKTLTPNVGRGYKVTTHIPQRAFLFDSGKATPENQNAFDAQIAQLGAFLLQAGSQRYACYLPTTDTSATIYVSGHTDRTGSDQTNLELSDKRAETVAEGLLEFLSPFADSTSLTRSLAAPVTIKSIGMGEKMAEYVEHPDSVANDADRRVDVVTSTTGAPFSNEEDWTEVGRIVPNSDAGTERRRVPVDLFPE